MEFRLDKVYRIKNKHTGMNLCVTYQQDAIGAPLEQGTVSPLMNGPHDFCFMWYIFHIDNGRHLVTNVLSSLFMTVSNSSSALGTPIEQNELFEVDANTTQLWLIDSYSDYHTIKSAVTRLYVSVAGGGHLAAAAIQQWDLRDADREPDSQLWIFEPFGDFAPLPPPVFATELRKHLNGKCLFTERHLQNASSDEVLIGQVVIPFPLLPKRLTFTPYYVLQRWGSWGRVTNYTSTHIGRHSTRADFKVGLTSGNVSVVKAWTGISIQSDESFGVNYRLYLYVDRLIDGLGLKVQRDYSEPGIYGAKVVLPYESDGTFVDTIWCREDRYVLYDSWSTIVLEWRTLSSRFKQVQRFTRLGDVLF